MAITDVVGAPLAGWKGGVRVAEKTTLPALGRGGLGVKPSSSGRMGISRERSVLLHLKKRKAWVILRVSGVVFGFKRWEGIPSERNGP